MIESDAKHLALRIVGPLLVASEEDTIARGCREALAGTLDETTAVALWHRLAGVREVREALVSDVERATRADAEIAQEIVARLADGHAGH